MKTSSCAMWSGGLAGWAQKCTGNYRAYCTYFSHKGPSTSFSSPVSSYFISSKIWIWIFWIQNNHHDFIFQLDRLKSSVWNYNIWFNTQHIYSYTLINFNNFFSTFKTTVYVFNDINKKQKSVFTPMTHMINA